MDDFNNKKYGRGFGYRRPVKMDKRGPVEIDQLIKAYIKSMKLAPALNTRRVFEAWDAVSGMSAYTSKKFFRSGVLYVTLTSSIVREQLYFQKDSLIQKMNHYLSGDYLFDKQNNIVGYVREIVFK